MADSISYRSSLSMGTMGSSDDDTSFAANTSSSERIPLRNQILNIVKNSPNQTIRPATLSNELGISITDASAELCGLLQVCSKGSSSFHFETLDSDDITTTGTTQTMVFVFPPDIEQQALQQQRKDDIWATVNSIIKVAIKILKMLTAFGLIISTVIVSIAGMVALVAALIALSRGGGGDSRAARHHVSRQLHNLFLTVRQLLWCYAMFGPVGDNDQDPFLREAAYDTSLVLSLCCGNPGSFWFWMRASHLRQRRRRYDRGWARTRNMTSNDNYYDDTASDLEGISLIRRGQWGGDNEVLPVPSADEAQQQQQHRGLLSVAVEFLFGPTSPSGPCESDKWKLRNAVIIQKSTNNSTNRPISLQELIPYVDSPPSSFEDRTDVISEGLLIVSHFNGRPANISSSDNKEDIPSSSSKANRSTNDNDDPSKALFYFPELISESQMATTRYNNNIFMRTTSSLMDGTDNQQSVLFNGLFYINETSPSSSSSNQSGPPRSGGNSLGGSTNLDLPKYLYEEPKVFSKLTSKQFFHCLLIAVLNFLGVIWFAQSLEIGGILEGSLGKFGSALKWSLIPVLKFYSKLFFVIPAIRLIYILCWNEFCKKRNHRRAYLASLLVDNDRNNNSSSSNDPQQGVVSTTL